MIIKNIDSIYFAVSCFIYILNIIAGVIICAGLFAKKMGGKSDIIDTFRANYPRKRLPQYFHEIMTSSCSIVYAPHYIEK